MKLFGSKGPKDRIDQEDDKEEKQHDPQNIKRRWIIGVFLTLAVLGSCFAAYKMLIKPPDISINQPDDYETDNSQDADLPANEGDTILIKDKNRKKNYFTFAVCATDEDQTRTDAMIMMSLDVENKKINLLHVPRDTMSNVKRSNKKINGAYNKGIDNTKKELNMLLGIPVDKYVVMNFDGIASIVDAIGGVKYDVPIRMKYDDPTQNLHIDIKPGMQTLNGDDTVDFLRWRKNNRGVKPAGYVNGDIGRVENQQKFFKAMISQALSMKNVLNVNKISKAVFSNVKTDLELGEVVWLGMQALKIDEEGFGMDILPGYSKTVNSLSYYIPVEKDVIALVNEKLNPYETDIYDVDIVGGDTITTKPKPSSSGTKKPTPAPVQKPTGPEKPTAKPPQGGDNGGMQGPNPEIKPDNPDLGEENGSSDNEGNARENGSGSSGSDDNQTDKPSYTIDPGSDPELEFE